jgi:hypothetical protein
MIALGGLRWDYPYYTLLAKQVIDFIWNKQACCFARLFFLGGLCYNAAVLTAPQRMINESKIFGNARRDFDIVHLSCHRRHGGVRLAIAKPGTTHWCCVVAHINARACFRE